MVPVGFGKTVVSHTAAQELIAAGEVKRVLIIAPLRVCNEVWAIEHMNWEHLRPVGMATGSVAIRAAVIESDCEIVCINFEVLTWFFEHYAGEFDGLIIDELTKFKGGGTQFKALRKHVRKFKWRLGMTGTLAEEGLVGLFYQVMAIDGGKTFGKNKKEWLREYFYPADYEERSWETDAVGSERLAAKIKHLIFEATVVENKPDLVTEVVRLPMTESAQAMYDELRREGVVHGIEAVNAAVLSGKLEQVANGFLYDGDELIDIHNEKIIAIINHAPVGRQFVIAYRYVEDLQKLREAFPDGRELRDSASVVADFNSGALSALFIHPNSGGHGLNLQISGCSDVIFYGPVWSRDQTDQVIGRVCRRGNPAPLVTVTTFVMLGTVEDVIMLPRLAGKGEAAAMFRDHLAGLI